MNIVITKTELVRALSTARATVPSRSTIPILGNVRLSANGRGRLDIAGTDLERQCTDSGAATITDQGAITVPADLLGQIAKALPDGDVSLVYDPANARIEIKGGRARYRLATLPADDYPDMTSTETGGQSIRLPAAVVGRLLGGTLFATSTEEARHYLMGCLLHTPPGTRTLRATATDGHRMVAFETDLPDGCAPVAGPGVIVPRQAQSDIGKLADGNDGHIDLVITGSRIVASTGPTTYTSKLVDGHFPDYMRVMPPADAEHRMTVDREALAAAVTRMRAILDDKTSRIRISTANGEICLSGLRGHDHEAADAVPAEIHGGAIDTGISARYMAEQLASMRGSKVRIEMAFSGAPFRLFDDTSPADIHVIMPMRV